MRYRILVPAAVLLVLLLFGLACGPLPEILPQQDKLLHLLGFAALAWSTRMAMPGLAPRTVVAACLALAALIELGQLFQPQHVASLADLAAGLAGACLGAWRPVRAADGADEADG